MNTLPLNRFDVNVNRVVIDNYISDHLKSSKRSAFTSNPIVIFFEIVLLIVLFLDNYYSYAYFFLICLLTLMVLLHISFYHDYLNRKKLVLSLEERLLDRYIDVPIEIEFNEIGFKMIKFNDSKTHLYDWNDFGGYIPSNSYVSIEFFSNGDTDSIVLPTQIQVNQETYHNFLNLINKKLPEFGFN